jgi:hypothetical protein
MTNASPDIVATPDDYAGVRWWNSLSERDRLFWLQKADSARPVDAWRAFKQGSGGSAMSVETAAAILAALPERIESQFPNPVTTGLSV